MTICRYLLPVIYASHATLDERDAKIMYLSPPCASRRPSLRHLPQFPSRKVFFITTAFRPWHLPLAGHEPDCFRTRRVTFKPSLLDTSPPKSHLRSRADAAIVAPVAMPSLARSHERAYSWPPSIHHLTESAGTSNEPVDKSLSDIDEDPFSHFISPVIEEDGLFGEASWTAGIVESESSRSSKTAKFYEGVAKKWSRYVTQTDDLYDEESDSDDSSVAITFEPDPFDAVDTRRDNYSDTESPDDSRLQVPSRQEASSLSIKKSKRTTHHRRHSWREPSVDLFTVPEENEASLGSLEERFAYLNIGESHHKPAQFSQTADRARL